MLSQLRSSDEMTSNLHVLCFRTSQDPSLVISLVVGYLVLDVLDHYFL